MSDDDAAAKAIEDLGDPEIIRDGMQSVYGPGVTPLFVEQAIKWKDRRWHIYAQIGLVQTIVQTIVLAIFLLWLVPVKIMPATAKMYDDRGLELPGFMQATISVLDSVFGNFPGFESHWYVMLIPPAALVGFFEWKCRSENKTSIRTFVLVAMSLFFVLSAFRVAGVTLASFGLLNNQ